MSAPARPCPQPSWWLACDLSRATLQSVAHYTVTFNYAGLHQAFSARTGQILERAAFLLTQIPRAEKHVGLVPNVQSPAIPVQLPPRPLQEVKADSERWVIAAAIRDCIEEVALFLEKTRELCAAVSLFEGRDIPAEQWNETVVKGARVFDRKDFPEKINFLLSEYGADLLPPSRDFILTLNAARNCLVHRQGVVGQRDCRGSDCLTVRWMSAEIHGRDPEGNEFPVVPPQHLVAETQLFLRHAPVERRFFLGERITFSTADLSGIWLTLHFFGAATAANVVKLAKEKGLIEEPEAAEDAAAPIE